jgi:hypothetical protein
MCHLTRNGRFIVVVNAVQIANAEEKTYREGVYMLISVSEIVHQFQPPSACPCHRPYVFPGIVCHSRMVPVHHDELGNCRRAQAWCLPSSINGRARSSALGGVTENLGAYHSHLHTSRRRG